MTITEEVPKISRDGNLIVVESPSFLSKEMVDEFMTQIDQLVAEMPMYCESDNTKTKRCAIILDFSKLSSSSMETDQMKEFVSLMARYHFTSLISIPPQNSVFGQSMAVELLNKSFPMFSKRGIYVHTTSSLEKAKKLVKTFPCFRADSQVI